MLTQSDLKQIKDYLLLYGKKDSQLSTTQTVKNTDYVAIVQDGINKTVNINKLGQFINTQVITEPIYITGIEFSRLIESSNLTPNTWYQITDYEYAGGRTYLQCYTDRNMAPQSFHRVNVTPYGDQADQDDYNPVSFDVCVYAISTNQISNVGKLAHPHTRPHNELEQSYNLENWYIEIDYINFIDWCSSIHINSYTVDANTWKSGYTHGSIKISYPESTYVNDCPFIIYWDNTYNSWRINWVEDQNPKTYISTVYPEVDLNFWDECDPIQVFNQFNIDTGKWYVLDVKELFDTEENYLCSLQAIGCMTYQPIEITKMISEFGDECNFDFIDLAVGTLGAISERIHTDSYASPAMLTDLFQEYPDYITELGIKSLKYFGDVVSYCPICYFGYSSGHLPILMVKSGNLDNDPEMENNISIQHGIHIHWDKIVKYLGTDEYPYMYTHNPPMLISNTYDSFSPYNHHTLVLTDIYFSGADSVVEYTTLHSSNMTNIYYSWLRHLPTIAIDVVGCLDPSYESPYNSFYTELYNLKHVYAAMSGVVRNVQNTKSLNARPIDDNPDADHYFPFYQVLHLKDFCNAYEIALGYSFDILFDYETNRITLTGDWSNSCHYFSYGEGFPQDLDKFCEALQDKTDLYGSTFISTKDGVILQTHNDVYLPLKGSNGSYDPSDPETFAHIYAGNYMWSPSSSDEKLIVLNCLGQYCNYNLVTTSHYGSTNNLNFIITAPGGQTVDFSIYLNADMAENPFEFNGSEAGIFIENYGHFHRITENGTVTNIVDQYIEQPSNI